MLGIAGVNLESALTVSALMRDAWRPRPGAQHRGRR